MNIELTYHEVLELLPAYALGALEPDEMLAVDDYLTKNRIVLDRLHQAELAAAQMAHAAPDAPLPVNAKNRLMARVWADLAAAEAETKIEPTPQPAESRRPLLQKQIATSARFPGGLAGLRRAFSPLNGWAVVAVCALIALGVVSLYLLPMQARLRQVDAQLATLRGEMNQLQATNSHLQETNETQQQQLQANQNQLQQAGAKLDTLQTQIAELQAANTQLQQTNQTLQEQTRADQELLALIATADTERMVQLPGTEEAPQAGGAFYLSDDNQGILLLYGLEPLPPDQTYQLWLIPPDGPPESAGLLAVQANMPTWLTLPLPAGRQDFTAVGVSVEPAGGSLAPTKVVLLGTVS